MYFLDGGAVPRGGAIFIFTSLEGRLCGKHSIKYDCQFD